jgi:type I restriction enzyme S subunit
VTVRWSMVPLGEVAPIVRRPVEADVGSDYPIIAARSFGRGTFHQPTLEGDGLTWQRLFQVRAGDLLVSNIKAWEGAVAVVSDPDDGMYCSHRYLTCVADRRRVLPEWLGAFFRTPAAVAQLAAASPGSADRNRTLSMDGLRGVSVPLPPLDVQRRIVERFDAVEARICQIRRLHSEIGSDLSDFVTSANAHFGIAPTRLGDALVLDEDRVSIAVGESYPQVGIRGFGGGLFPKPPVEAGATTYRHFNRLHAGHFVMSQVKGWEGAVAVCDATFEGMYASPEYRTFRCVPERLRPTYLSHLCTTPWFHEQLAQLTRGQGARRERLRPELLLDLFIPLPDVEVQTHLEGSFDRLLRIRRGHDGDDLDHLLPAMLAEAFGNG